MRASIEADRCQRTRCRVGPGCPGARDSLSLPSLIAVLVIAGSFTVYRVTSLPTAERWQTASYDPGDYRFIAEDFWGLPFHVRTYDMEVYVGTAATLAEYQALDRYAGRGCARTRGDGLGDFVEGLASIWLWPSARRRELDSSRY